MDFLLTSEQLEKNINLFLTVLSEKGYSEPICKGYRSALRLTFSYILTTEDSVYSLEASERFIHSMLDALSVSKSYRNPLSHFVFVLLPILIFSHYCPGVSEDTPYCFQDWYSYSHLLDFNKLSNINVLIHRLKFFIKPLSQQLI